MLSFENWWISMLLIINDAAFFIWLGSMAYFFVKSHFTLQILKFVSCFLTLTGSHHCKGVEHPLLRKHNCSYWAFVIFFSSKAFAVRHDKINNYMSVCIDMCSWTKANLRNLKACHRIWLMCLICSGVWC